MGEISIAMNDFLRNKKRFADLFNGFYFHGQDVIKAEELSEGSEQYGMIESEARDGKEAIKFRDRQRDVKMFLQSGAVLSVLAVENQNAVDYTMPFRAMQYDCLEYGRQLRELKNVNERQGQLRGTAEYLSGIRRSDRLTPVYSICLYHGEEKWDGPRSLRDMIDFGEDTDGMSEFFSDYPLKLFCLNEQTDFEMLHTELKEVFMALKFRKDKMGMKKLLQENEAYHHLNEETLMVLSKLLGQPQIWEDRAKYMSQKESGEEYDMCQALKEWMEDERIEGRAEGRGEMLILVSKMLQAGDEDRIPKLADESFLQEMCKLYGVCENVQTDEQ